MTVHRPKFRLGTVYATPAALNALEESGQDINDLLARHAQLEQGGLCDEDHEANAAAVQDGSRILSAFPLRGTVDDTHDRLWIITESVNDSGVREQTTLLLSHEY